MKKYLGLLGIFLLFISSILPIASLNNSSITLLPFFDNFTLQGNIWEWRDISAIAVTYPIIIILMIIFFIKGKVKVVLPLLAVLFFILFFILVSLWMTSTKTAVMSGIDFSLSFGWIVILIGFGLVLYSSAVMSLKK